MIRRAEVTDAARMAEIYNQAIETKHCTCNTLPFTARERAAWFLENDSERTPIFAAEEDGLVVGYGYLSGYRTGRQALEKVAEVSYYLDFGCHGRGIGSALMAHLIESARALGYETLLATLLDSNEKSKGLLRKFGFERWGLLPGVADFGDRRDSLTYFGRPIDRNGQQ